MLLIIIKKYYWLLCHKKYNSKYFQIFRTKLVHNRNNRAPSYSSYQSDTFLFDWSSVLSFHIFYIAIYIDILILMLVERNQ